MKVHAETAPSLWQALAKPVVRRPSLKGKEHAEVVIVGAGIAGLSLALHLADAGRHPVILEAETPGAGALGASAGIVAPQLVRDTPSGVIAKLGAQLGAEWLKLVGESGRYLFDLIDREEIECDARPYGFIAPAAQSDAYSKLTAVAEEWRPFRNDLTVLPRRDVELMTGLSGYEAATLDHSGGCLDPLQLANGIAQRSEKRGATIFENSRVRSIAAINGGWRLTTRQGTIDTPLVVLCANGGNTLHPWLDQTILPMHIYEMATEPVSSDIRASILPGGQCMTDLEMDILSLRYAADDRLITAYPVGHRQSIHEVETQVNSRLKRMFARPAPIRVARLWHGTAWINSSLLPRIVEVESGMMAIQACNGRGIATNMIIGREVSRMILGGGRYESGLSSSAPKKISQFWLAKKIPNLAMSFGLSMRRLRFRFRPE